MLTTALVVGLSGCAASEPASIEPSSASSDATTSRSSSPGPAAVQVPSDGVALSSLGFANGPRAFSVPRTATIRTRVDQVGSVTLVLGAPAPSQVADYLRRALPATGFVVTGDDLRGAAMTFTGYGWSGDFTGSGELSAIVLRG